MIVADSSVWIDHLNNDVTRPVSLLRRVIQTGEEPILVGDLVLCKVLQGLRNERESRVVETALRQFQIVEMLNAEIAVKSAANFRLLRDKGITIRKTIDMIIGTYCIEQRYALLHDDRDFDPMARHLGLRVLSP